MLQCLEKCLLETNALEQLTNVGENIPSSCFWTQEFGKDFGPHRCFPLETGLNQCLMSLHQVRHLCHRFKNFLTVLALKTHSLNFFSAPCWYSSCPWCFPDAVFVNFSDFLCYCFLETPSKRAEEKPTPLIISFFCIETKCL